MCKCAVDFDGDAATVSGISRDKNHRDVYFEPLMDIPDSIADDHIPGNVQNEKRLTKQIRITLSARYEGPFAGMSAFRCRSSHLALFPDKSFVFRVTPDGHAGLNDNHAVLWLRQPS